MLPRTLEPRGRAPDSAEPWSTSANANANHAHTNGYQNTQQQQQPPYQSHDPSLLKFPDVPTSELPPIQPSSTIGQEPDSALPSISSLTGQQYRRASSQLTDGSNSRQASAGPQPPWSALSPRSGHYSRPADSPARLDLDTSSTVSAASPDYFHDGRASSVSLDDPDVRLAAEALGDLRADFLSSPPNSHASLPMRSPSHSSISSQARSHPEPLLSLLTTSHPLIATTIGGAASAYNSSKNYSPRFKSSAEYVEGYLTPIAGAVGSVGRVTGVEGSVRWFLGGRKQSQRPDIESGHNVSHKRRKVTEAGDSEVTLTADEKALEAYGFKADRRLSQASTVDTLPAYENSPAYTETPEGTVTKRELGNAPWQSRLIMSTSGLSVAMSEESLRSLKYCLTWLRWANRHIAKVIASLKTTLEQYEQAERAEKELASGNGSEETGMTDASAKSQANRRELAARIASLRDDVLKTLRDVVETVSKYTGGALPENARVLVRRHLTSLPRKWQLAMALSSQQQNERGQQSGDPEDGGKPREKNIKEGAQRVLVLAKEGLEMMAQVSGVLDGTIVSAEEWCERLGKRRRQDRDGADLPSQSQSQAPTPAQTADGDVKMS